MKGAADTIKRVTLELGGKSANVVFADADLEAAAAGAPSAVFGNAGQDCCARSRILVEQGAYDRFLELLIDSTKGITVGDPEDAGTEMGPLVSAGQRESVSSYVDGNVAYRGNTPDGSGFWFPPTLVEASNDDRVAREEVFGPVAAVIPFEDEAGAVRGVLHFVPCYGRAAMSLSFMRRDPGTPNGLTEFLVVKAIELLREREIEEISLNFAAFAKWMHSPEKASQRALGKLIALGNPFFQIESLYRFNAKFFPRWEPRYLVYEGTFGLPRAGIAAMWAEGQLYKPALRTR